DDAGDESVLVGDVQILERLVIVIERLHQERVIDTGCPQFGQEVVGREITGETVAEQRWQRPLALGDPPKVLVGVDDAHVAPLELTRLMDANVAELVIRRLDWRTRSTLCDAGCSAKQLPMLAAAPRCVDNTVNKNPRTAPTRSCRRCKLYPRYLGRRT